MPDDLLPVPPADLEQAIGFALTHRDDGKAWRGADSMLLRIVTERVVNHLARSDYVVMRKPVVMQQPDVHYGPSVREASGRK